LYIGYAEMLSVKTNCHKQENWAMHYQLLHAHDLMNLKNLWVGAAVVGFSRRCVHLVKSSCTEFFNTLYFSLILLVVALTETSITHHAGELTLHCLSPSVSH